jgi:hypothetical protein
MLAVHMAVPETAMDDNNGSVPWKDNIRAPRQPSRVKPESTTHPVKHGPHFALRRSVPTADTGHVPTSTFAR